MEDSEIIPEIIATTVSVMQGADIDTVTKDFDDTTAQSVSTALVSVKQSVVKAGSGVQTL